MPLHLVRLSSYLANSDRQKFKKTWEDDDYHRHIPEEPEHWTDYWGLICGVILLIIIMSVMAWAYMEDQKELATMRFGIGGEVDLDLDGNSGEL